MENLSLEDQRLLQTELSAGESLIWTGKPNPRVIFHSSDWFVVPFSLLWGGFAILWEAGVSGAGPWGGKSRWDFGMLWGIPFVVIGQYMIWGRFFYNAWRKRRIVYALTNERVITIVTPPQARVISAYLRSLPGIEKEFRSDGIGTLKFGETLPFFSGRGSKTGRSELFLDNAIPVFVDIDDAAAVADLATRELRRIQNTALPPS